MPSQKRDCAQKAASEHARVTTSARLFSVAFLLSLLSLLSLSLIACGRQNAPPAPGGQEPVSPSQARDPIRITEVNLEALTSQGLPVILNFGDKSEGALDTLDALERIDNEIGDVVIIRSVDLAASPEAKEGFPVPVVPSQFFYGADGKPISLPLGIGIILSSYISVDSEEPVFVAHEGPITFEELLTILDFMGVIVYVDKE